MNVVYEFQANYQPMGSQVTTDMVQQTTDGTEAPLPSQEEPA